MSTTRLRWQTTGTIAAKGGPVPTTRESLDKALERMGPLDVSARAMFGEYGLYLDGRFFGVVCKNTVFIKVTDRGAKIAGRNTIEPPFPGAKPWFKISAKKLADREWLTSLISETAADLLPQNRKPRQLRAT